MLVDIADELGLVKEDDEEEDDEEEDLGLDADDIHKYYLHLCCLCYCC